MFHFLKLDDMTRITLMLLSLILCVSTIQSQSTETLFGKTGLRITGIWGGPATNFTGIGDDFLVYKGGFGGIEFNKSVFLGWAGFDTERFNLESSPSTEFDMKYNGLILGYTHRAHKVLHPSISVLTGSSKIKQIEGVSDRAFVLQPSIGAELNIFKWFKINLEGGYRMVQGIDLNGVNDKDLSKFFGELRFKFGFTW